MKYSCFLGLALRGLSVMALSALGLAQTTWYVDVGGTPPGSGTPGDPYTSIQYAIDRPSTVDHDKLLVAPGVYVENLVLSKRVRVEATGGPDVTSLRSAAPGVLVTAGSPDIVFLSRLCGFTLDGSADPGGTAILTGNGFSMQIERCVIRDFTSGRAVDHHGQFLDAFQSTLSRNGIGVEVRLALDPGQVSLIGCIVRGNGVDLIDPNASALYPLWSCVPPGAPGTHNVTAPPGFWDEGEGDLRLRPGSPCIDAGGPALPLDPDGSPADIGAYTYDPAYAPGPTVFCTAKTNSQGCVPQIGFTGHATATGSAPFLVTATQTVPGKAGLLFYGPGKRFQPFQGAWHCVQLPTKRVGAQVSTGAAPCSGTYGFDFGAYIAAGSHPQIFPGALIACQWWSRDPLEPAGFGTGLTDALYLGVAP